MKLIKIKKNTSQKMFLVLLQKLYSILIFMLVSFFPSLKKSQKKENLSVNFHFTRRCNYSCHYCFHTDKGETEDLINIENSRIVFQKLKTAGTNKINFAGGEPFLKPKFLGELVMLAKVKEF